MTIAAATGAVSGRTRVTALRAGAAGTTETRRSGTTRLGAGATGNATTLAGAAARAGAAGCRSGPTFVRSAPVATLHAATVITDMHQISTSRARNTLLDMPTMMRHVARLSLCSIAQRRKGDECPVPFYTR